MIKTYEDWENSLDKNYVNQLSPDAWDLTCEAFEAGQQSQQAKIDELQARVDEITSHVDINFDEDRDDDQHSYWSGYNQAMSELNDILKGNKDEN